MSIFDVHVNRAPVNGMIDYIHYNPGKYLPAYREKASLGNEQMKLGIKISFQETKRQDMKIMVKLIAGYIARRIVLWKRLDDTLKQGERIGMIKFGSRVEVYLPLDAEILAKVGDTVKAGNTVLAKLKNLK